MSTTEFDNLRDAISAFVVGYNKAIVLSSVTGSSLNIVNENIDSIRVALQGIVAAFEEIRATSETSATNAGHIDETITEILINNTAKESEFKSRIAEIENSTRQTKDINVLFSELQQRAKGIESITENIQDVSDRTNILAINASIEAARAGAVGGGFRIIANEVRNLAGQTGDFAQSISESIKAFNSIVIRLSSHMDGFTRLLSSISGDLNWVQSNFEDSSQAVHQASSAVSQIAHAITEQNTALNDGLKSLENISQSLNDSHAVFQSLSLAHTYLDSLLDKES